MTNQATAAAAPRSATEAEPARTLQMPLSLFAFAIFYGGMVCIAGVLGNKQVALGPLAVEAGIFAFLMLVITSSAVAELFGRSTANRLVRTSRRRAGRLPVTTRPRRRLFREDCAHDIALHIPRWNPFQNTRRPILANRTGPCSGERQAASDSSSDCDIPI